MASDLPGIQDLARRIVTCETVRAKAAGTEIDEAVQVCEKLRIPISRLAGIDGFSSLLLRALALAKGEVPALRGAEVRPDGSLVGFTELKQVQDAGSLEQGRVVLVAHLLGLLATFIGEPLTRRLACDAWPEALVETTNSKGETNP